MASDRDLKDYSAQSSRNALFSNTNKPNELLNQVAKKWAEQQVKTFIEKEYKQISINFKRFSQNDMKLSVPQIFGSAATDEAISALTKYYQSFWLRTNTIPTDTKNIGLIISAALFIGEFKASNPLILNKIFQPWVTVIIEPLRYSFERYADTSKLEEDITNAFKELYIFLNKMCLEEYSQAGTFPPQLEEEKLMEILIKFLKEKLNLEDPLSQGSLPVPKKGSSSSEVD